MTNTTNPKQWLLAGSLVYRLTDESRPQNCDEINVTMADGDRHEIGPRQALAAQIQGFLNSLSDVPDALITVPDFKPFTMFIEAYSLGEYDDDPGHFKIEVDAEFIGMLLKIQRSVIDANLSSGHKYTGQDEAWGEPDLRPQNTSIVVKEDRFWFEAYPKYGSHGFETRAIDIIKLLRLIEKGEQESEADFAWCDGILFKDGSSAKSLAITLVENEDVELNEDRIDNMPDQ